MAISPNTTVNITNVLIQPLLAVYAVSITLYSYTATVFNSQNEIDVHSLAVSSKIQYSVLKYCNSWGWQLEVDTVQMDHIKSLFACILWFWLEGGGGGGSVDLF